VTTARRGVGQPFGRIARAHRTARLAATESHYQPGAVLPAHLHEAPYFCWVASGGFTERRCGREREQRAGDLIFHPAGEVHSDRFGSDGATCCNVELHAAGTELAPLWTRLASEGSVPPASHALAVRIHRELRQSDAFTPLAIEALALELLVTAARGEQRLSAADSVLERVRQRLHDDPAESHGLASLAAEAGLHRAHLARAFRARYGVSIGEYLRQARVERAIAELSRSSDAPVSLAELALRCGFADQSHFTRVFRRRTGTTPGRFRRRPRR
jgi:AraC family transcriptional regulator